MTFGTNDHFDTKECNVFDDECKCLHCGPNIRLIVELDEDGWSWFEKHLDDDKSIVHHDRFPTFMEAINNYEEVIKYAKRI